MTTVAADPARPETVPWDGLCETCEQLHEEANPGLFSWVESVGRHMATAHGVQLVIGG